MAPYEGLAEEMAGMRTDRKMGRQNIANSVSNFISDCHASDRERAENSRNMMTQFRNEDQERAKEIQDQMKTFKREDKQRAKDVSNLKNEVSNFKNFLQEENQRLANSVSNFISDCRIDSKQRSSDVNQMISNFAQESANRARDWQSLLSTLGKGTPKLKKVPAAPAAAATERPTARKAAAEKRSGRERQILTLIGDHPEGIKLVDLEEMIAVPRIVLARTLRALIDDGQVVKKGNLYYLSSEELSLAESG